MDGKAFMDGLMRLEDEMEKDCELFAGDIETPEDVRKCVMAVIALAGARHNPKTADMDRACHRSQLSADMHGLFHDIARMRYVMRYGMVFDDPAAAVAARDRFVEKQAGKRHPWQKKAPSEKPPLKLGDAPRYCHKAITLE